MLGYITLQWLNPFDLPNAHLQTLAPDEIDQRESDSRGYVIAEILELPWDVLQCIPAVIMHVIHIVVFVY